MNISSGTHWTNIFHRGIALGERQAFSVHSIVAVYRHAFSLSTFLYSVSVNDASVIIGNILLLLTLNPICYKYYRAQDVIRISLIKLILFLLFLLQS